MFASLLFALIHSSCLSSNDFEEQSELSSDENSVVGAVVDGVVHLVKQQPHGFSRNQLFPNC